MPAVSSLSSVGSLSASRSACTPCYHAKVYYRGNHTRKSRVSGRCQETSSPTNKALWVETSPGYPNHHPEKPERPCTVCEGQGKVTCGTCRGIGRTNASERRVLPLGVWPTWCNSCRGSGLWYCQRCMGTGMKRDPIGFQLPHMSDS